MTEEIIITAQHKNCLSTYLGDWMTMIRQFSTIVNHNYDLSEVPATFISLHDNEYDLCVTLSNLDSRLKILENNPVSQLDHFAYSEARVFLKAFFVFFHIVLDNVSGIIEFLYKKNEPDVAIPQNFSRLLKRAQNGPLTEDLSQLILQTNTWVPEVTDIRDDLVHFYDSLLISFEKAENGNNILGYFNTKGRTSRGNIEIRAHFGRVLCQYQMFIDDLLDHLDNKFKQ